MKKWLFIIPITVFLIFAGIFYWKISTSILPDKVLSAEETILPTPTWKQSIILNVKEIPFRISWAIVDPGQVELYSNLKAQQLSEEIKVDKSCQILVNGGFYSKENTHLGLFITNFETLSESIQSSLLNGFLWINSNNAYIGSDPDVSSHIAIQSGPLFMLNNELLRLDIKNDEPDRRIVAATIDDNKLIFLAVYADRAEHQGPLLSLLPEIIDLFEKQTNINIVDAVNLDGGKHSVFISNYDRLNELEHVGSYFCIK